MSQAVTMLTVYFDTSFYIDLGEAEEAEAARALAELERADIRQVLSPRVYAELALAPDHAETQARALARLARARRPALDLSGPLDWSALGPGPERQRIAAEAGALDDAALYLHAVTSAANETDGYRLFLTRRLGEDAGEVLALIHASSPDLPVRTYNAALRRKAPDVVRELGEVEPGNELVVNHIRLLRHNAEVVYHGLRGGGFEPPTPPALEGLTLADSLARFEAWMADALGPEAMAFVESGRALTGTIGGSHVPDPVVARARLASVVTGEGLLPLVASFADDIDLVQLDRPSVERLAEHRDHYLHQMGLGERCFAAPGLAGALDAVRSHTPR